MAAAPRPIRVCPLSPTFSPAVVLHTVTLRSVELSTSLLRFGREKANPFGIEFQAELAR